MFLIMRTFDASGVDLFNIKSTFLLPASCFVLFLISVLAWQCLRHHLWTPQSPFSVCPCLGGAYFFFLLVRQIIIVSHLCFAGQASTSLLSTEMTLLSKKPSVAPVSVRLEASTQHLATWKKVWFLLFRPLMNTTFKKTISLAIFFLLATFIYLFIFIIYLFIHSFPCLFVFNCLKFNHIFLLSYSVLGLIFASLAGRAKRFIPSFSSLGWIFF